ncbi:MAG TPA: ATP-binding protein [Propionibacteriaceae bacterium]|nr:ATP-binding protein [Propionibacteriaceae bacterium]
MSEHQQPDVVLADPQRLQALRRALEERAVLTYCTDGATFRYQRPLSAGLPVGSYVTLEVPGGATYFGQVITQQVVLGEGPLIGVELDMDLTDDAGASKVSQLTTPLRLRLLEGTGTILGRLEGDGLARTTHRDIFDAAELAPAGTELVERYLRAGPGSAVPLPVGRCSYVDGEVEVPLRASGFDRHTFLCGQSGSGKTFSLGVMLEQLLLQTELRLVVLDPNSDFVALGTLRDGEGIDERLAGRYQAATASLRVARPPRHANQTGGDVRIRFSDLTRAEQAEVLQLDPLAAREEFSAFWQLVERLGRQRYSLTEVERLVLGELSAEARQLGLRIANLDVAGWEVWCEPEAPSLVDVLDGDDNVVVDLGTLASPLEQAAVSVAVLGSLWRARHRRRPLLLVIDEAHNVCPGEPASGLAALATEYAVRIAGEGRKYGLYLLLASQRPQKLHPNVVSQCDNLVLMRMSSNADLAYLAEVFSQVPASLLGRAPHFTIGQALIAGRPVQSPTFVTFGRRLSREGGSDIPATWATRAGQRSAGA